MVMLAWWLAEKGGHALFPALPQHRLLHSMHYSFADQAFSTRTAEHLHAGNPLPIPGRADRNKSSSGSGSFLLGAFPREWRRIHLCYTNSVNLWLQEATVMPA